MELFFHHGSLSGYMTQQEGKHIIHRPVDLPIGFCPGCKDFTLCLHIPRRDQLIPAIQDQRFRRLRRRFQMKLKSDHGGADLKRLVFARLAFRQPRRSRGQVKRLPVPVENLHGGRKAE